MRTTVTSIICALVGCAVGWALGTSYFFSRSVAEGRDAMRAMEADDRSAVLHSALAIVRLEEGQIDAAKQALAKPLASFWHIYGPPEDATKKISSERASTLKVIAETAERSPTVKAELEKDR